MACSTTPMNVYPMAWVGMIAFVWMFGDEPRPGPLRLRQAFAGGLRGWFFGFGANLVALRFISLVIVRFAPVPGYVGPIALILLAAFEALRWVIAAVVWHWLVRLRVGRALAFSIGVYAGTFLPTMIPWTVADGVCPWPATVQLAELIGERGVAWLMAFEAALAAEGLRLIFRGRTDRAARPLAAAAAMVALSIVYGAVRIRQIDALRASQPSPTIALIEPAIEANERWDPTEATRILAHLTQLTLQAERDGADLVIWPEGAYPYWMPHTSRHPPMGDHAMLQPGVRGPLLTGLMMSGDQGRKYNSTVIAMRDGARQLIGEPYDKMHLMWFGEMVPFEDSIPWLRDAFSRGVGLRPGERQIALEAGDLRIAVLNCLEDILPGAGLEAMSVHPNLLVNVTNDAWFAGSAESEYHLLLARLRSIELRRDLLRAVNFGPTTWVDAAGRIVARIAPDKPGILMATPALLDEPVTLYATWGDWPLRVGLVASCLAGYVWRRRGRRRA
jgi:apolipoprotein N-acyltransferase